MPHIVIITTPPTAEAHTLQNSLPPFSYRFISNMTSTGVSQPSAPPPPPNTVDKRTERLTRWYFGGLAGAGAATITHPLDLLKVIMQTQQEKVSLVRMATTLVREQGFRSLYNGISASLLRQLTYSMTRFGLYEAGRQRYPESGFGMKVAFAGGAGSAGGFVGVPSDVVNVRMQNDVKLPPAERRNYKHVFDGFRHVYAEGGLRTLFAGFLPASVRGCLLNIGQIVFYDEVKFFLLRRGLFDDTPRLHFVASLVAGGAATMLTQPVDVVKTRVMNAKPGEYSGLGDVIRSVARAGPMGFFKGFIPAFVRLGPHTVLMFLILEQLRLNFGPMPAIR